MQQFRISILALLVIVVTACTVGKTEQSRPILAVSIEPQRQMLEALVDKDFEVVTLLARGANPETFETTMSQQATASRAAAYISLGVFPFEKDMASRLGRDALYVDCSKNIEKISEDTNHDHHHTPGHNHNGDFDPHYWTSVKNMKIMANSMCNALISINPDEADKYSNRLDSICNALDSLDATLNQKLANAHRAFAIWHPSLTYFANDYDLKQISIGYENKDISPRKLFEIVELAKADSVGVMFFQKEFDSRQASTVSDAMSSRLVVIDPLAYDWQSQLITIADELAR